IGDAETLQGRLDHRVRVVVGQLPFDADAQLGPVLRELPCIMTTGRLTPLDADVPHEIFGMLGFRMLLQISRRGDGDEAPIRPDAHRDHVLFDALSEAYAGIEPVFDNVAELGVEAELDLDVR